MPISMLTKDGLQISTVAQQAKPCYIYNNKDAAFMALANKLNQPQNVAPT
jgi:hypothetical protein